MENLKRYASGRHTPKEIRWHLAALAFIYWGLVFCAWIGYNGQNTYSIMSQTLSALGSFDDKHNPHWFWLFSVAMIYCGLTMIPVMLYVRRRFAAISGWGALVGAVFFVSGCVGLVLVGLLPYSHGAVAGIWKLKYLHVKAAGTMGVMFGLGMVWHALLLLKDRFTARCFAVPEDSSYLKFIGPYLVLVPVLTLVGSRIEWHALYTGLQAAVRASLGDAANAMQSAMAGRFHSFSILEHVAIWALTVFVIWFTAVLPYSHDSESAVSASERDTENVYG